MYWPQYSQWVKREYSLKHSFIEFYFWRKKIPVKNLVTRRFNISGLLRKLRIFLALSVVNGISYKKMTGIKLVNDKKIT